MQKNFIWFAIFLVLFCPRISSAKTIFSFAGQVNLSTKEYDLAINLKEQGAISAHVAEAGDDQYEISVKIDHLKFSAIDVSTELKSRVEFNKKNGKRHVVSGKVGSQYTIVNYKPFYELSGSFEIKDKKIFLNSISLGVVACRGYINLFSPHYLDVTLQLASLPMEDFISIFLSQEEVPSAGWVTGKIQMTGEMEHMLLNGQLVAYDGFLGDMAYESIGLNFTGVRPIIAISDSSVIQADGLIFSLEGPINLSDKKNLNRQIDALTKSPLVNVGGKDLEWTFKRIKMKGGNAKTELKYLFKKDGRTGQASLEDLDMLGLERSIEF
ncbi:MAG: hypothetical protein WC552_03150 [Candidatus Omnitrophota bacterium]